MHSEKGILHWIRNILRSQFLLDSYFNGNFFPHIWILHAAWSLKSWSYSKFMNFQYAGIGKVSQIILNYQERILHLSNFIFQTWYLPLKNWRDWRDFLSPWSMMWKFRKTLYSGISRRTQKYSDHWFSVCFPKMMEAAFLRFFEFLRKSWWKSRASLVRLRRRSARETIISFLAIK